MMRTLRRSWIRITIKATQKICIRGIATFQTLVGASEGPITRLVVPVGDRMLRVGAAQIAPVWLNKAKTVDKVLTFLNRAKEDKCDIVAFGEALVPGYPYWLEATNGCMFNNKVQKQIFAHYSKESVDIEGGDLDQICQRARELELAVILGIVERGANRGGQTLYCSSVYIDDHGTILSVHRKLMPTYDERLVWGPGDGHGLRVHPLKGFQVSRLNCWENWMPLPRASIYAQGSNVHFAHWPGSVGLTKDITRFIAMESRSFVISVGNHLTTEDFCPNIPHYDLIKSSSAQTLASGGSCISGPDGKWIVEPQTSHNTLIVAELDMDRVREERQNFDPAGHYSRPDVTKLVVNRSRQSTVQFEDQ